MGSRGDLKDVEKRKFLTLPGLNSALSVVQSLARPYTYCAIADLFLYYFFIIIDVSVKCEWKERPHSSCRPDVSPPAFDLFPKLTQPQSRMCSGTIEEMCAL
jgi:hypothetical protein